MKSFRITHPRSLTARLTAIVLLAVFVETILLGLAAARPNVLLFAGFPLVASLALIWLLIRRTLAPLKALARRTSAAAQGQFDPALAPPSEDEVGPLAKACQDVVDELRRSVISRELLDSILSNLEEAVVVVDESDQVEFMNVPALELFGDQVGREFSSFVPCNQETSQDRGREAGPTAGETGSPCEIETSDGRWLQLLTRPIRRPGRGRLTLRVIRDITEEKQLRQQLIQSEKLSAVGELVSGVAHELNNPLTAIIGFAELLIAADLPEKIRAELQLIHDEAHRCGKIVANLVSFARRHRPERQTIQLNDIVRDTVELRSYDLRVTNIQVEADLDPDLPTALADPNQMQQVFLNIINNAQQAVAEDRGRGTITIRSRVTQNNVRFTITDDGPGIAPENLSRVFDPFFTTKDVGEGTGLGLSLCYGIIQEHGGRISASSRLGEGTTFTLELPVHIEPPALEQAPPAHTETVDPGPKRILAVDDEESILRLLSFTLGKEGHTVETARSGISAIQKIQSQRFDAIICDLKMPGIDGFGVYDYLRRNRPELTNHLIIVTGDTVSPETKLFIESTGVNCIEKPFYPETLSQAVQEVMQTDEADLPAILAGAPPELTPGDG